GKPGPGQRGFTRQPPSKASISAIRDACVVSGTGPGGSGPGLMKAMLLRCPCGRRRVEGERRQQLLPRDRGEPDGRVRGVECGVERGGPAGPVPAAGEVWVLSVVDKPEDRVLIRLCKCQ